MALRDRVTATVDPALKEEQVRATIVLKDGRRLDRFIEHVVGSVERPMSDADLEAKFMGLTDGVLPQSQARTLIAQCWAVEGLASAADLAIAARLGVTSPVSDGLVRALNLHSLSAE